MHTRTSRDNAPFHGLGDDVEQAVNITKKQKPQIIAHIKISMKQKVEALIPLRLAYNNNWSLDKKHRFCDSFLDLPSGTNSDWNDVNLALMFDAAADMLSTMDGINYLFERNILKEDFCRSYMRLAVQCALELCFACEDSSTTIQFDFNNISIRIIYVLLGLPDNGKTILNSVPPNLPRTFGKLYERIRAFIEFLRQDQTIVTPTRPLVRQFMVEQKELKSRDSEVDVDDSSGTYDGSGNAQSCRGSKSRKDDSGTYDGSGNAQSCRGSKSRKDDSGTYEVSKLSLWHVLLLVFSHVLLYKLNI